MIDITTFKEFFYELHSIADRDYSRPILMYNMKGNHTTQHLVFAVQGSPFKAMAVLNKEHSRVIGYIGDSLYNIQYKNPWCVLSSDLYEAFCLLDEVVVFVPDGSEWDLHTHVATRVNMTVWELMHSI